jgi:hypothetical protein
MKYEATHTLQAAAESGFDTKKGAGREILLSSTQLSTQQVPRVFFWGL